MVRLLKDVMANGGSASVAGAMASSSRFIARKKPGLNEGQSLFPLIRAVLQTILPSLPPLSA
jgi:hypothetical protein